MESGNLKHYHSAPSTQHDGGLAELSLASRMVNGALLFILFAVGILANITVYRIIRKPGVLFKKTTLILLNLVATDLLGCVLVIPMEFLQYVLNVVPSSAPIYSSIYFSFSNFTLWMDCSCVILLSLDRKELIRRPFTANRSRSAARVVKNALVGAWILAAGEAVLTYFTSSDRVPWKFYHKGVFHIFEPGNLIANLFVFITIFTVVISFCMARQHLKRVSKGFLASGISRQGEHHKRQHRISRACIVTVCALFISYVPAVIATVVWWASDLQSYEVNSLCAILSSLVHMLNPLIYAGMSQKVRNAKGDVLPSLEGIHRLAKKLSTSKQPETIELKNVDTQDLGKNSEQERLCKPEREDIAHTLRDVNERAEDKPAECSLPISGP